MKKILDFLKKIGLLHSSHGDYSTGEYGAEKNNKNNFKIQVGDKTYSKSTLKIGLWLMIIVGIIMVILSLMVLGFILMFLVVFGLWLFFAFWIKQKLDNGNFKHRKLFTIFTVVVILTIIFVLIGGATGEDDLGNTKLITGSSIANSQQETNGSGSDDEINLDKEASSNSYIECAANDMEKKNNKYVSAKIASVDNVFEDKTLDFYSKNEFIDLAYGYTVQGNKDPFYVAIELCSGEMSISRNGVSLSEMYEAEDPEMPFASTNMVNFSRGGDESIIKDTGDYTVYVYTSDDGIDWGIGAEVSFEVK